MDSYRNAVKGLIVNDEKKLLLVRSRKDDPTRPGTWDAPGGRLELGENPMLGVMREVKEETDLEIEVKNPLGIHHFTRDDGQHITMIVFWCLPLSTEVKLDKENSEFKWVSPEEARQELHESYDSDIAALEKYFLD